MFLRREQNTLLEQLQRRSASLAAIYRGGLQVLADEKNPTRFQLAAHAFRELISHCNELTGTPVRYGDGMKQRLAPVKAAFADIRGANTLAPNRPNDSIAVSISLYNAVKEFLEWDDSNRPETRRKAAILLAQLAGPGPALPSDVAADDLSGWLRSDEYFKAVAHHQKLAERDEFTCRLFAVEDVLLRRMQPRPVTDLDEIDALIKGAE